MASYDQLILQRNALILALEDAQKQLTYTQQYAPTLSPGVQQRINQIQADIDLINQQIAQLQGPIVSSGTIVQDDAYSYAEQASPQNPILGPLTFDAAGRIVSGNVNTSGTNAETSVTALNQNFGLNDPVRSITNTQSVVPVLPGTTQTYPYYSYVGTPGIVPTGVAGVGAGRDDTAAPGSGLNPTQAEIDSTFNETQIASQPNVLDQYSSYNYVASVYITDPVSYNQMMKTKQKVLGNSQLLFQTGGASVQGRSQYFTNDYYIEKIDLKSKIFAKSTGLAYNATEFKLTVVEPSGITLIDNLQKTVQDFLNQYNQVNPGSVKGYTQAIYLLCIKFYGYDDNGNLVQGGVKKTANGSDANAFVEKWYPFIIKNIGFRIQNKLVEYEIECTIPPMIVNASSNRGSIPYNIELAGQTLQELLSGPAQYSSGQVAVNSGSPASQNKPTTQQVPQYDALGNFTGYEYVNVPNSTPPAPAKANTAPSAKKTIRQGLIAAMNDYQAELKAQGKIAIPDQYYIEFLNPSLASAKLKKVGNTVKKNTPMAANDPSQADPNRQSMDSNARNMGATAGTQIIQFLDQVLKNSTYLSDQAIIDIDEKTGEEYIKGTPAKNIAWYRIGFQTEQLGWDEIRNDYAYKITYKLQAYRVNQLLSKYFPIPMFKGVVKSYKYWFTGENTSVLNYEEKLNNLYHVVMSGSLANNLMSSSANAELKYMPSPRSGESSQGAQGATVEIVANAAEGLYSPGDLKTCNLTIVGDPAWLQQGEAWAGFFSNDPYSFSSVLPDGTINVDGQQPMFEVSFNKPKDYNLDTGLMSQDPINQISLISQAPTTSQISRLYYATECESIFDRGKFTQRLTGSLYVYDPTKVNQYNSQIVNSIQSSVNVSAQSRQLTSSVNSILSGTPYAPIASVLNGQNNIPTGGSRLINTVLGGIGLRNSPVARAPTSLGLPVGTTNGAGIIGTPGIVNSEIANAASGLGSTPTGDTQPMAAGDDSGGYVSNMGNPNDPFSDTVIVNPND